jgi:hypothetical protein
MARKRPTMTFTKSELYLAMRALDELAELELQCERTRTAASAKRLARRFFDAVWRLKP